MNRCVAAIARYFCSIMQGNLKLPTNVLLAFSGVQIITSRLIESETKPGLVARVLDQFGIDNALKEKVEDFMG